MRLVKRTVKDNVFTTLFSEVEYIFQLYQALHPEDKETDIKAIDNVTINNVLINGIYNDLGFTVNKKLIILVEAQSTWSVNIAIRSVIYLMSFYKEYAANDRINLYGSKKVELPKPELYVIYTGERKNYPDTISLARDFFNCDSKDCCIDATIKIIYDSKKGDIINQYKNFVTVYTEQVKLYDYTQKAVAETIKICKNKNILKEFLSKHKHEVITMYDLLFDQDFVMECYKKELREDIRAEVKAEVKAEAQNEAIEKIINTCKMFGDSKEQTLKRLKYAYSLTDDEAKQALNQFWKDSK